MNKRVVMDRIRVSLWVIAFLNLVVGMSTPPADSFLFSPFTWAVLLAVVAFLAPRIQNYLYEREISKGGGRT
jgi:hypothetical protein